MNSSAEEPDEVEEYLGATFSKAQRNDLNDTHDVSSFWGKHEHVYPVLRKVSLQIIDTPAFSTTINRDFSHVNHILKPERSNLNPDLDNNLHFLTFCEKYFNPIAADRNNVP